MDLKKLIVKYLRELADKIDGGNSEITEEEAIQIIKQIAHEPLSKVQAYKYLGISRAKFDNLIKEGKLPNGKKRQGFKELVWYKDELIIK